MRRLYVTIAGIACAVGAATVAVAQEGTPSPTPSAVACASPVASPAATPTTGTAPAAGTPAACDTGTAAAITVELIDIAFKPAQLTAAADTAVTVTLHNGGAALHNFSIDRLNVSQDVLPGETKTVTIQAPAGVYPFFCDIPGHKEAGMVGVLHLE